jgi:hypothetical protein
LAVPTGELCSEADLGREHRACRLRPDLNWPIVGRSLPGDGREQACFFVVDQPVDHHFLGHSDEHASEQVEFEALVPDPLSDVGGVEGCGSVGDPLLAAFYAPACRKVVDRRVDVIGVGVDGGAVTGSGKRDVGELTATAIFEVVGRIDGGSLGAVDGDGVAVRETVVGGERWRQENVSVVVEADGERAEVGVDLLDGAGL